MELSSGDDGIHADASIIILGGEISIKKSYEGIESQNISINGSVINLIASDDGINCAGGVDQEVGGRPGDDHFATDSEAFIIINSGDLYINANGDGIDSNGTITVNGGNIVVEGPTSNGNSALDYGISATINGGTFIAIGSSGMATNFTNATQGVIMYNTNNNAIGTVIKLFDSNGKVLHEFKTTKAFSSVIISTKDMSKGNTYKLEIGSSSNEITLSSLIYSNSKGMGGPGGPKPPR